MIRMAVFDMAGTTVNEDNLVYKTVQQSINQHGYQFSLDDVLAAGAGKEKLQAIKDVLALQDIKDDALAGNIFEEFKVSLKDAYENFPVKEQQHAGELFKTLKEKGILVVLNTGYDRATAEFLVKKIGWKTGVDIDALVTASDVPKNRPSPDMIVYAMEQFGIANGAEVVKVGDSAIDIEEGKNAGCGLCIGITTGAQTREQLEVAAPDHVINDLMELVPLL